MKKILYLISFLFAVALVGCEEKEPQTPPTPDTPSKVETGVAENIASTSATLKGMVNVDIIDYEEIVFGVLYSTKAEELDDFTAPSKNGFLLIGNEFKVNVTDLKAETKYYYRAYVMLNNLQILLGDVKEFTTLEATEPEVVSFPFSVAIARQVTFSPGNLQYHPANDEWRFAPSQLDYIGDDNANISETYNGWIDLFGWGTGNNPTNKSKFDDDYQTFVDWGVNKIGSDAPNTWRTLTYDEWEYIINGRFNAEELIGVAQVNGVNGLILLPDGWTCPDGVSFKSGVAEDSESFADYQSFSASEWSKLEANGAVFFPASGFQIGSEMMNLQQMCCYWASDAIDEEFSFTLVCESYWLNVEKGPKYLRQSVRLVKNN